MKLLWDEISTREYETGVDHGVLFPVVGGAYTKGVSWSGLSKVTESPSGGESTGVYADNIKYLDMMSNEEFGGTIEAYMYPDEFAKCDGSEEIADGVYFEQQNRRSFGFAYRTLVGNDTEGTDHGYKLHLVYGAKANPSSKDRSTVNDSPEATSLSWEFKTTPVNVTVINPDTNKPYKAVAHIVIKSTKANADKITALENILYGTDNTDPRLPLPDEVYALFAEAANPLSALTVDSLIADTIDLDGKAASDLQTGISVGANAITGTLKYVDDYTGYSTEASEQAGNYLALHCTVPGVEDVTITANVSEDKTVDSSNGTVVLRIADKTAPLTVTASKVGYEDVVKTYSISGLILQSA